MSAGTGPTAGARDVREEEGKSFRRFLIIWAAQLVARIGNGLTAFGLAVHVYERSGLSTSVALVTMAALLPAVVLAPVAGVLADRLDRRLLMVLGDTASAGGLVALLVVLTLDGDDVLLICACVAASSVCSSVMDPAYRATISDLLSPEQYARASGLVQFAAASQYLVSPALAGVLMAAVGIRVVVAVDISTMVVTVGCMLLVWRSARSSSPVAAGGGLLADFRQGLTFFGEHRGVMSLMLVITVVTFCMGFLQTLLTPMVLDLSTEQVLGVVRSLAAVGMVVASLAVGILNMGIRHRVYIRRSLTLAGAAVFFMGCRPDVLLVGAAAFVFFAALPTLNTSVEVLVRASVPAVTQGRAWGMMSFISQLGYLAAYAVSGPLADLFFNPLLVPGGALSPSLGRVVGVGDSRGIGLMFMVVAVLLLLMAQALPRLQSVQAMEAQLERQVMDQRR